MEFSLQALREIKVQINTNYKKEKCFYRFQISVVAVSAIEGHSYISALSCLLISSK